MRFIGITLYTWGINATCDLSYNARCSERQVLDIGQSVPVTEVESVHLPVDGQHFSTGRNETNDPQRYPETDSEVWTG